MKTSFENLSNGDVIYQIPNKCWFVIDKLVNKNIEEELYEYDCVLGIVDNKLYSGNVLIDAYYKDNWKIIENKTIFYDILKKVITENLYPYKDKQNTLHVIPNTSGAFEIKQDIIY